MQNNRGSQEKLSLSQTTIKFMITSPQRRERKRQDLENTVDTENTFQPSPGWNMVGGWGKLLQLVRQSDNTLLGGDHPERTGGQLALSLLLC